MDRVQGRSSREGSARSDAGPCADPAGARDSAQPDLRGRRPVRTADGRSADEGPRGGRAGGPRSAGVRKRGARPGGRRLRSRSTARVRARHRHDLAGLRRHPDQHRHSLGVVRRCSRQGQAALSVTAATALRDQPGSVIDALAQSGAARRVVPGAAASRPARAGVRETPLQGQTQVTDERRQERCQQQEEPRSGHVGILGASAPVCQSVASDIEAVRPHAGTTGGAGR